MAKGRKHGSTDRHDRLLGTYGYANGHLPSADQPDLGEDDVWLTSSSGQASNGSWTSSGPDQINPGRSSRPRHWSSTDHRDVSGLSLAFEDQHGGCPKVIHQYHNVDSPTNRRAAAASAPVDVPNWSKMVRTDSAGSMNGSVELDSRDGSREWVPPHEYLAREHGRAVTTSVFEGVGRTLKGRDMSRVRDGVWSETGFFG